MPSDSTIEKLGGVPWPRELDDDARRRFYQVFRIGDAIAPAIAAMPPGWAVLDASSRGGIMLRHSVGAFAELQTDGTTIGSAQLLESNAAESIARRLLRRLGARVTALSLAGMSIAGAQTTIRAAMPMTTDAGSAVAGPTLVHLELTPVGAGIALVTVNGIVTQCNVLSEPATQAFVTAIAKKSPAINLDDAN